MKFCIPIEADDGLDSSVSDHFGSAPRFMIVDAETRSFSVIPNADADHAQGGCNPLRALNANVVDIVITGSLGGSALVKMNAVGIRVFRSEAKTVIENLNLLADNHLQEFVLIEATPEQQGVCCPH
ncbi:MAG TPA: NifB/NifX family molybdenum-iron cluster-binding protein [Dissulfurispiraceae bacterium]|nr:NifB/NifX family molybdenum-iron cluster-binding protein [Dissulfurispiraceae bacterium]